MVIYVILQSNALQLGAKTIFECGFLELGSGGFSESERENRWCQKLKVQAGGGAHWKFSFSVASRPLFPSPEIRL